MKKTYLKLLLIVFIPLSTLAQEQSGPLRFFDELNVSVNRTVVQFGGEEARNGFGIGLYKTYREASRLNFLCGLSYDKTSQFMSNIYLTQTTSYRDLNYTFHNLSLPVMARLSIGKGVKYFFELGVFMEMAVASKMEGTRFSYVSGLMSENGPFEDHLGALGPNGGYLLGLGAKIPVGGFSAVVKFGTQFGLRDLGVAGGQDRIYNQYAKFSVGISRF